MQKISVDTESNILYDLVDKMHNLSELAIARPDLAEIFNRNSCFESPKEAIAIYRLQSIV